jgi:hypothetical protein
MAQENSAGHGDLAHGQYWLRQAMSMARLMRPWDGQRATDDCDAAAVGSSGDEVDFGWWLEHGVDRGG